MRVGQKNKLTYRWARKGSRPRAAHDQRTQSTYLFGAVCPERGAGAALLLPACNCEAMQLHLDEIATKVIPGAHAIVLLDQAGWHGAKALVVPNNISLVPLPPRAPELNGQENIWQFMRHGDRAHPARRGMNKPLVPEDLQRLGSSRSLNLRIGIMSRIGGVQYFSGKRWESRSHALIGHWCISNMQAYGTRSPEWLLETFITSLATPRKNRHMRVR